MIHKMCALECLTMIECKYRKSEVPVMMYRKLYEVIGKWEKDQEQKPLMVIGARQVGKTWLMKKFCQDVYHDYVYINLEERNDIASVFDRIIPLQAHLFKGWIKRVFFFNRSVIM